MQGLKMRLPLFSLLLFVIACGGSGNGNGDGGVDETDSDGDTISDTHEGAPDRDTDGDGTPDAQDDDSDNDGLPDYREAGDQDVSTPPPDSDGDGRLDVIDNCRAEANPGQQDADTDGIGDACDPVFNNTSLVLDSEPGDYVGAGLHQSFTAADGTFTAGRPSSRCATVQFQGDQSWFMEFCAPAGQAPDPGSYTVVFRYAPRPPTDALLYVGGAGRGCNVVSGRFDILEAVYGPDGEVERFAADFEQHCEGQEPALFGRIRLDASDPLP
jgi:hypothetical protein